MLVWVMGMPSRLLKGGISALKYVDGTSTRYSPSLYPSHPDDDPLLVEGVEQHARCVVPPPHKPSSAVVKHWAHPDIRGSRGLVGSNVSSSFPQPEGRHPTRTLPGSAGALRYQTGEEMLL